MIQVHILKTQNFNFVNYCYIAEDADTKSAVLVDPSWQPELIQQTVSKYQLKPTAVLVTHHHPDHIHLAPYLSRYYDIPIYMGAAEINCYGIKENNLIAIDTEHLLTIEQLNIEPIFTPGHTYGGICYLIHNNLFTGDTLFNEGCGICLGKGADPYQMFNSLQKLKKIIKPDTIIYPGHCYGLPVGQSFTTVMQNNTYLHFSDAEQFVAFRMRSRQQNLFDFK